MVLSFLLAILGILYAEQVSAQKGPTWTASPFNAFSLPLVIRNPYLNTWLPQGNSPPELGGIFAKFWSNIVSLFRLVNM